MTTHMRFAGWDARQTMKLMAIPLTGSLTQQTARKPHVPVWVAINLRAGFVVLLGFVE